MIYVVQDNVIKVTHLDFNHNILGGAEHPICNSITAISGVKASSDIVELTVADDKHQQIQIYSYNINMNFISNIALVDANASKLVGQEDNYSKSEDNSYRLAGC